MSEARVLIVHKNEDVRSRLRDALSQQKIQSTVRFESGTVEEGAELAQQVRPHVIFAEVGENPRASLGPIGDYIAERPAVHLVGLLDAERADKGGSSYVIRAVHAGVHDFVRIPLEPGELDGCLSRLMSREREELVKGERGEGRIVCVFSNKGGSGKTALAVNLAVDIARRAGLDSCCLVDVGLQVANAHHYLDIRPRYSLADAADRLERLDAMQLRDLLSYHDRSGLSFLGSPESYTRAEAVGPEALRRVLLLLKSTFRFVIVDTYSFLDPVTLSVLDLSDLVYFVTEGTVPAASSAQRFLGLLGELDYPAGKVRVVLNRNSVWGAGIRSEDLVSVLGQAVDFVVPQERRLLAATNEGIPLTVSNPGCGYSRAVSGLAAELMGVAPPQPPGLIDRIRGRSVTLPLAEARAS